VIVVEHNSYSKHPWQQLPPEVETKLRPFFAGLSDEIIAAVATIPDYQRPLEGEFGVGVRAGVEQALANLLDEIAVSGPVPRLDVYRQLGRGEMRAGRSLESLLSAYRLGARVAWRRAAAASAEAGIEPELMYQVAEAIFAYIDMLSAESAEGYALEQTAVAGQADIARRYLVRLLVREPAPDPDALRNAALDAGWEVPKQLAAVAIGAQAGGVGAVLSRLPLGAIAETIGDVVCVILPDPEAPRRRAELESAVDRVGLRAGLGTTVAPAAAAVSFNRARAVLALGLESSLVSAREHAGELLLAGDSSLAAELAADRLAPMQTLTPGGRERMMETLEAWLAEQGRLGPVSERLGIHPQTARYRLARLRELFGDALDDGDERFWLQLALRSERRQTLRP
jgi:PucR C-terminal helix-turn-helix domain